MKKLSDVLPKEDGNTIRQLWSSSGVARETGALPPGTYEAQIIAGEVVSSRTNSTPGYKLTFQVIKPSEYASRHFWHYCWFTPRAIAQAKRDLGKLGVTELIQLDNPLPQGIRCQVQLGLQADEKGNEQNRVRSFEVIAIDGAKPDAVEPVDMSHEMEVDLDVQF